MQSLNEYLDKLPEHLRTDEVSELIKLILAHAELDQALAYERGQDDGYDNGLDDGREEGMAEASEEK